jgi:hypothetical protein
MAHQPLHAAPQLRHDSAQLLQVRQLLDQARQALQCGNAQHALQVRALRHCKRSACT